VRELGSASHSALLHSSTKAPLSCSPLTMSREPSAFGGEWWWPKLTSMPLPPEPQPQDRTDTKSFESDLELGVNVPLPTGPRRYHNYIEQVTLTEHRSRLPHYKAIHLLFDPYRETGLSTVDFSSLRYCDIQRITYKLLHLRDQLVTGAVLSEADLDEMNRLLRAQGTSRSVPRCRERPLTDKTAKQRLLGTTSI
jgi:hypothetical protein